METSQLEALILAKTRRVVVTGEPGTVRPPPGSSAPWPCARVHVLRDRVGPGEEPVTYLGLEPPAGLRPGWATWKGSVS